MIDPTFDLDEFMKEMHDYIIPEVLESFLHNNKEELKNWCSEAVNFSFSKKKDQKSNQ